jgi:hypothetical protein
MLDWFLELLNKFGDTIISVLPVSPFAPFLTMFKDLPFLGYLNWFIPVGTIVKVGLAWLAAIALFYIYSIIMRWVKMIGD